MRNIYNTVNNNKKDKGRWGQPATAESRGTDGRLDLGLPQRCEENEVWFQERKGGKLSQRKDTPLPEDTCEEDSVDWRPFRGNLGGVGG